jgi:protein-tyrosine-phosphatase/DNA-binding transcriptional ArsR family regulator
MKAERNDLERRAAVHAALGDPGRLAVVDALVLGEASPSELQQLLDMPSNLMAHHVRILHGVGLVTRHRSEADRRRTYLSLVPGSLDNLRPAAAHDAARVVFVCTQNSARSQLAAAIWNDASPVPASSAGTHPAAGVHPGAVAAAHRYRVRLVPTAPQRVEDVLAADDTVITVCDAAHEELSGQASARDLGWLHWSIPDPARSGRPEDFDRVVDELITRVGRLAPAVRPTETGGTRAG